MNKSLILVVEDDTPVRNLITTTLKAHEYRHLTAVNGESAILEASSHNPDIVLLDAGADDYLTKPFSVEELLARLRVTERRLASMTNEPPAAAVFTNGGLRVNYAVGCAYMGEEELHLTSIEYRLLCLLSRNVGKVLTHTFHHPEDMGKQLGERCGFPAGIHGDSP